MAEINEVYVVRVEDTRPGASAHLDSAHLTQEGAVAALKDSYNAARRNIRRERHGVGYIRDAFCGTAVAYVECDDGEIDWDIIKLEVTK